jgi:hypothetical protein
LTHHGHVKKSPSAVIVSGSKEIVRRSIAIRNGISPLGQFDDRFGFRPMGRTRFSRFDFDPKVDGVGWFNESSAGESHLCANPLDLRLADKQFSRWDTKSPFCMVY